MEEEVKFLSEEPVVANPANPGVALLRRFVEGNYLYVISALVMIAGCYLLMRAAPNGGGEFTAVLRGLAVLQGYELLILGTSALIVRRFSRLDDAFTLLAIELALLLDPTFFVNNFHTLMQSDRATGLGIYANTVCFGLVIAKLLVLQGTLRFRLSPRAFAGFVLVAALVYLSPRWLAVKEATVERHGYFFALCWTLPLLALAMPGVDRVLSSVRNSGFLSPAQRTLLPRLFLVIPALLLPIHLGESWYVHNLTFFGAFLSPLFVAAVLRLATQPAAPERRFGLLLAVDALALVALMLAFPAVSVKWREVHNAPAPWLTGVLPLAMTGFAVAAGYLAFHRTHGTRAALVRVALLAAGALAGAAWRLGAAGAAVRLGDSGLESFMRFLDANPAVLPIGVWLFFAGLWWRFGGAFWEICLGVATLVAAWWLVPDAEQHGWETTQLVVAWLLVVYHRHGKNLPDRLVGAVALAAIGLVRFQQEPGTVTAVAVALECLSLALAGWSLHEWRYKVPAGLQAFGFAVLLAAGLGPAVLLVGAGALLFLGGVAVTFRKERLLAALAKLDEPSRPPKPQTPDTLLEHLER